jgi:arginase
MTPEGLEALLKDNPAKVVAFGLPFDHNSSYMKGASLAPWEIQKMLFHEAGNPFSEGGFDLTDRKLFLHAGTLSAESKEPMKDIEKVAKIFADGGRKPIFIGGDHSVTFPILKGLSPRFKALSILHVDAHPDLYPDFQGNPYSHASPFARILENRLCKRLVQVGIRTLTGEQRAQVAKYGVEVHEMIGWSGLPKLSFDGPVYISIDIDGLDPAFAPGVSHREPGGLSTREVLNLVHLAGPNLVGGDVVEYNPRCDIEGITGIVAARLVREIAGAMLDRLPQN